MSRLPLNRRQPATAEPAGGRLARVSEDPAPVFAPPQDGVPPLELKVNFGLFSGREATPAEIEQLGRDLLAKFAYISIVSERRFEIGADAEGTVHQVRVEVGSEFLPRDEDELAELRGRLLEVTERWVQGCVADRHAEISDGLEELLLPGT